MIITLTKIYDDEDTGLIYRVKKLIFFQDIISIEDTPDLLKDRFKCNTLTCITTTSGEMYVKEDFKKIEKEIKNYIKTNQVNYLKN